MQFRENCFDSDGSLFLRKGRNVKIDWTVEMESGHKNDVAVGDCFCAETLKTLIEKVTGREKNYFRC